MVRALRGIARAGYDNKRRGGGFHRRHRRPAGHMTSRVLWSRIWRDGTPAFHLNDVHPFARHLLGVARLPADHALQVLLPMCGKSVDLLYFAKAGAYTVGVEFSKEAISQFSNEITPLRAPTASSHNAMEYSNLHIWQGDMLRFASQEKFHLIFDRGGVTVLDQRQAVQYARLMRSLIDDTGVMGLELLHATENDQALPDQRYSLQSIAKIFDEFSVQIHHQEDVTHSRPDVQPPGDDTIAATRSELLLHPKR